MIPGIVAAGSAPGGAPPEITVSIDFKNDVYEILGVSKTLAETVEENLDWGDFDPSDIAAGVGLRVTSSSAGPVNLFRGPVLTSEALAAALPDGVDVGFTAVMTYSVSHTGSGRAAVFCESVLSDFSSGWGFQGSWYTLGNAHSIYDYDALDDGVPVAAPGAHIAAITLCAARLSASVDGDTVVTHASPQTNSTADLLALGVLVDISSGHSGPSTAILERIDFYAIADDAELPALSA